jgi:hypothetical protein
MNPARAPHLLDPDREISGTRLGFARLVTRKSLFESSSEFGFVATAGAGGERKAGSGRQCGRFSKGTSKCQHRPKEKSLVAITLSWLICFDMKFSSAGSGRVLSEPRVGVNPNRKNFKQFCILKL